MSIPLNTVERVSLSATGFVVSVKWQGGPKVLLSFEESKKAERWAALAVSWVSFLLHVPQVWFEEVTCCAIDHPEAFPSQATLRPAPRPAATLQDRKSERRSSGFAEPQFGKLASGDVPSRKSTVADAPARDEFSSWGYRKINTGWESVFFRLTSKTFLYFHDDEQTVPLGYMDRASVQRTECIGIDGQVEVVKLYLRTGHWRVIGLASKKLAVEWSGLLATSVLSRVTRLVAPKKPILLAAPDVVDVVVADEDQVEVSVEVFGAEDEAEIEAPADESTYSSVTMEMPDVGGDNDYYETESPLVSVRVGEQGDVTVLSKVQEALSVYDSQDTTMDLDVSAADDETIQLVAAMEEMLDDLLDEIRERSLSPSLDPLH
jgi:hypothetical protein